MWNRWGAGLDETGAGGAGRERLTRPLPHPRVAAWKACLLMFVTGLTIGCYVYVPVATTPVPGEQLALDINDQGRVGLGERIGAAASKVEGTVQANTDSAYQLRVTSVSYMNGQSNPWTGEALSVRKDFVSGVRERKFSRGRTFFTAAAIVGTAAAFIISRNIFGGGSIPIEPPPPPPGGGS